MAKKPRATKKEAPLPRWYRGADIPMRVIRRYARQVAEHFQPDKIILAVRFRYPGKNATKRESQAALRSASRVRSACRSALRIPPPRRRKK